MYFKCVLCLDSQQQLLTKVLNSKKKTNYDSNYTTLWKLKLAWPACCSRLYHFWQRVRFECSQSKRCIKMQHFLSFLYLLTPTDEFLFEVEYYTANNLHPCKFWRYVMGETSIFNILPWVTVYYVDRLKIKQCSGLLAWT